MSRYSGSEFDNQMMDIALAMAKRGLGQTAPNPSVGAIVVDQETGEILGRGWTQPGGRPHAEPVALAAAGERARGKTLYVTLEPCSHFGKTPPCVSAIISAGIARVVCGITDPDPRVSGRGLDQLRDAGVDVQRSIRLQDARWVTRGHVLRVSERRPFVQLKLALGRDGRIAQGSDGQVQWVTSPAARAHGHLLRAQADAILVGAGTLRDDNPDLTCRLPGLEKCSPRRVVLAGKEQIAQESQLLQSAANVPVHVFYGEQALADRLSETEFPGLHVHQAQLVGGRIWLPAVLERLAEDGVTRVLVEGGPTMWRSFSEAGLIDEVIVYQAGAAGDAQSSDEQGQGSQQTLLEHVKYYVPQTQLNVDLVRRIENDHITYLRPAKSDPGLSSSS